VPLPYVAELGASRQDFLGIGFLGEGFFGGAFLADIWGAISCCAEFFCFGGVSASSSSSSSFSAPFSSYLE